MKSERESESVQMQAQALHKRARAKFRKAVTGDSKTGVRKHIKTKVREVEHRPKWIKEFDKMAFTLGVLNLCCTQYFVFAEPAKYWMWYSVIIPILLSTRWQHYKMNRMQYFLLDFCYSVNIFTFIHMYLLYDKSWSEQVFRTTFILVTGPLPAAIPVWRNSLVFHDVDRTVSVYIHTLPMCLYYTLKRSSGFTNPLCLMDYFYALLFYMFWQFLYLMKTEVLDRDKLEEEHLLTSLKWLASNTKNALSGSVLQLMRRFGLFADDETFAPKSMKTKGVFVTSQLVFTLISFIPTYWAWNSSSFHLTYICAIFTTSIYYGASYYVEVFSKRYVAGLEQAAAERKTATRNVEVEGEGGDASSSAEGKADGDFYEGEEDNNDGEFDALLRVD
jgi:hypothetical protein